MKKRKFCSYPLKRSERLSSFLFKVKKISLHLLKAHFLSGMGVLYEIAELYNIKSWLLRASVWLSHDTRLAATESTSHADRGGLALVAIATNYFGNEPLLYHPKQ